MNDDASASGGEETKEPSAADEIQEAVKSVTNQLSGGERLIAIGALLVIVVDLFLGVYIMAEYGLANSTILIPAGILAAMYFYYTGSPANWHQFYVPLVKVGAWAMAIIGVDNLIWWLRSSYDPDGWTTLFEIVFSVAAALFAVGAWQMKGDNR